MQKVELLDQLTVPQRQSFFALLLQRDCLAFGYFQTKPELLVPGGVPGRCHSLSQVAPQSRSVVAAGVVVASHNRPHPAERGCQQDYIAARDYTVVLDCIAVRGCIVDLNYIAETGFIVAGALAGGQYRQHCPAANRLIEQSVWFVLAMRRQ